MPGRTIAIGDIHGCRVALETLLDAITPSSEDTIITLGDYVDRGPDSRGVIERLISLSQTCHLVPLCGNHEEMMLSVLGGQTQYTSWLRYGGVDTLDSYGFCGDLDVIPESHHQFFDSLRDYHETPTHLFTHAAYDPGLPLDQQSTQMLRWHSLRDGVPDPHTSGKVAVVGHTANKDGEILDLGHLVCIDTYCYGGGWLTALDVDSGQLWKANDAGVLGSPAG
ncbi:metallophosphoesterase family protein [Roseimaritima ulvae]|uniref:Serine/threonine-protein phosphatase 1 n=1 Tax=Roseimaritima ulvae TaxID=980254 RepID=A0A5B9R0T2_9BACT|nr:metallophosphoesterase family protein [Roseimaritima ulvae]QEG39883.1 Serine/threonine-protein phosphatase 1 [Roseimaritima ulvae]